MNKIEIVKKLKKIIENNYNTNMINELLREVELDTIKNETSKINKKTIFKRMIKTAESRGAVGYMGTYIVDNKYTLCDGFRLIEFQNENDEIAKALLNTNECVKSTLKYDDVVRPTNKFEKIDMELLEKIINYNKINKSQVPYVIKFTEYEYIVLNAQWLKELLLLNDTNIVELGTINMAPISIISDNYKSILLPIREKNDIIKSHIEIIETLKKI